LGKLQALDPITRCYRKRACKICVAVENEFLSISSIY